MRERFTSHLKNLAIQKLVADIGISLKLQVFLDAKSVLCF